MRRPVAQRSPGAGSRTRRWRLLLLALGLLALVPLANGPRAFGAAPWIPTGSMIAGRSHAVAVRLANGDVLLAGGEVQSQPRTATASAELYDPVKGTWRPAASMSTPRADFTATLLTDGRVLAAGGTSGGNCLASAELYDPRTNAWSSAGAMSTARCSHTATLLDDGRVLVIGGVAAGQPSPGAEIYDPRTNSWAATAPMARARAYHTATRLSDGRVLVAGGLGAAGPLNTVELYDPSTGKWGSTFPLPPMVRPRYNHTATLLPDGGVLVTGGRNTSGLLASAELFDPGSGFWRVVHDMGTARALHTATLLPDGDVLVTGGEAPAGSGSAATQSAELYDPGHDAWTSAGTMSAGREAHVAVPVGGRVLIAGGWSGSAELKSAELYAPPEPTPTPTSTPRSTPTATPTRTVPPPPPPPQNTALTPTFSIEAAKVEQTGTQPDWSLSRASMKRVTAGTRVRLSVYVSFTALSGTSRVAVSARVHHNGRVIYQAGSSEVRSGAGRLWDHWSFTPQQAGGYIFEARVRVGDHLQIATASFTVTAPRRVTFTFDRLDTLDEHGRARQTFTRTERVVILAELTIRHAVGPVRVTVGQTLQYSSPNGWKLLGRRVESSFTTGNGVHPYTVSYVPQTRYSLLRMVIDLTVGSRTLRRAVAFQVLG